MKRLHIHLTVADLAESIRFYSTLFATAPSTTQNDYAKWILDDPRVNFAISTRGGKPRVNHLGLQVETADELSEMHARLQNLHGSVTPEIGTSCCYANSDKYWTNDPQDIAWETFHTLNSIPVFSTAATEGDRCCVPSALQHRDDDAPCCEPMQSTSGGCC
ncbi:MAG: ArsI/CadI family heavy metal resistance metalloenzyme [Gammaproteobacteria bacterium]